MDLEKLYQKLKIWKSEFQNQLEIKQILSKENIETKNETLEIKKCNDSLQLELTQLNNVVMNLKDTIIKLATFEIENKKLLKEIDELHCQLRDFRKEKDEVQLKFSIEKRLLLEEHQNDIKNIQYKADIEKKQQLEVLHNKLTEKDQILQQLELEKKEIVKNAEHEYSKLKLICDKKIEKLETQLSVGKAVSNVPIQSSIFLKKTQIYQEQIKRQNELIETLREEITILKSGRQDASKDEPTSLVFDVDFSDQPLSAEQSFGVEKNCTENHKVSKEKGKHSIWSQSNSSENLKKPTNKRRKLYKFDSSSQLKS